jgi:two-component system chemotaxis response regulator CheY
LFDDSETVRQQVEYAITHADFEVIHAEDGVIGWEKLIENEGIGLTICDVNMLRMGGLELVEKIKESGQYDSLPIIMLTTEGSSPLIKRAKKAGAKGWVVKPFKADLLVKAAVTHDSRL